MNQDQTDISAEILTTIEELYANNQKKLYQMCNKEISKFGGVSQKDYDDFYSRVGYEIARASKQYDPLRGKTFMEYVSGVIKFAIKKEMTDKNRYKRQNIIEIEEEDTEGNIIKTKKYIPNVSIDAPVSDEEGLTIGDTLQSDFDMEESVLGDVGGSYNENIEKYLMNLSKIQREILELKMKELPVSEIIQRLGLSNREYEKHSNEIKSFANISILYGNENNQDLKEDVEMSTMTQTMEKSKQNRLSISSIIKKIDKHTIRFDHPLQRESEQWTPAMKGNLISDILQGNPIPSLVFAEQVVNGIAIIWDLDGKQRCTNAYSFSKDGYKITKNIRRWLIEYQAPVVDKNGNALFDNDDFPVYEKREFDIRGKKFSELPEELQDKFNDYNFEIVQYLNCSGEDIAYHIARYNEGKPMTASQKGITRLGEEYAGMVKSISNMPFFKDLGGYKVSEFKNGTINRVVVESVMSSNYIEKWGKLEDMCRYINENANTTVFDDFEDMVGRLEHVITDETSDMFNSKNSFLWFGLFARFVKSESDDKRFIEFMTEFTQSLHSEKINDVSFDDILESTRNTKDKGIVTKKMNHLISLMDDYLHNDSLDDMKDEKKDVNDNGLIQLNVQDFISKNIDIDKDTICDDMDVFNETLDDLSEKTIRFGSKLLEKENRPSLLAMVAYSYSTDQDLDDWLVDYASKHNTYFADQKKNLDMMIADFEQYNRVKKISA